MYRKMPGFRYLKKIKYSVTTQPLWRAIQNLRFELKVFWHSSRSHRKLKKLEHRHNLKVNLGCGPDVRGDWVNIDLLPLQEFPSGALFFPFDFRRKLPLPNNSCKLIYSSHVWEHLDYATGLQLFEESYRCLTSGGVFRIVLPDLVKVFTAYLNQDITYFNLIVPEWLTGKPQAPILLDYVNYAVYQGNEHKYIYDTEKLHNMLHEIGYQHIHQSEFNADVDIDTQLRRKYSFYMEAQKP